MMMVRTHEFKVINDETHMCEFKVVYNDTHTVGTQGSVHMPSRVIGQRQRTAAVETRHHV